MRLEIAFHAALVLGVLSSTATPAFISPLVSKRSSVLRTPVERLSVGGWENDDFLDALSGGNKARDEASQDYQEQSQYRPGEPPPPAAAPPAGETPPGGPSEELMRRMGVDPERMQQAQQQQDHPMEEPPLQYQPPPPQYQPPPPQYPPQYQSPPPQQYTPPPQQQPQPPPGFENMPVEDQARMFREFMAMQQQQQQQQPPQYQQQQPLPEQQQYQAPAPAPPTYGPRDLDVKGRKIGRNKDADAIANTSDLYMAQLKTDSTIRTRARYAGDVEKANAIMQDPSVKDLQLRVNPYLEKEKELLETSEDEMLIMLPPTTKAEHDVDYAGVNFRERFKAAKQEKQQKSAEAPAAGPVAPAPTPVAAVEAPPKVVTKEVAPPPAAATVVQTPTPAAVVSSEPAAATGEDSPETRSTLRTLMGLMLKHRGGPGMGTGRLKGPEAERFENSLNEVTTMLRSEAILSPATAAATVVAEPKVSAPPTTSTAAPEPAAAVSEDRLAGTIACVEGAVAMFKNSAPEQREGDLIGLRAALLAAVNTCNQVIAENEVANKQAYDSKVAPQAAAAPKAPAMGFPDTYQVAKPEEEAKPVTAAANDENSQILKQIYDKLQAASGNGKLGLKSDMTPEEAGILADELVEMRGVLMEELEAAPTAKAVIPSETSAPETGSGSSKYKQMLTKAKAEKAARKGM